MGKKGLFERLIRGFKRKSYRVNKFISRPYQPRKTYTAEEKLRILKELEGSGMPISVFAKWKEIAVITIQTWQNAYKTQGEKGLESKLRSIEKTLPAEVIERIIKLKTENPSMGSPKISDWLARNDFIKVSANAILNLLKKRAETKDLVAEAVDPKNEVEYKPKTFERSKPKQMYQMDITNWHLKGLYNVYIIACLDDYSRYIASWGIFRRQTSEHCIDVLRGAIEQFNSTPEEVLTDNGRQFYTWRGKNEFQKFLLKMGIRHIRSRPYHPQTLGKIESFWRNMYQELLSRETIMSFEDLEVKMRQWIDQYNFKRPHQGIGGLVPADRFFGVEKQVREAMLEGAGMVKDALVVDPYRLTRPMYLIGRIGDKEIRVLAKDGSVIVQGVESVEKRTIQEENLQDDKQLPGSNEPKEQENNPIVEGKALTN
jgi:transposase InsO family protein